MKRPVAGLLAAIALLLCPSVAAAAETCAATGPTVCVALSHTPDSVSASAPGTSTYAQLGATVRNAGTSTATHVRLVDTLPAGTQLISLTVSHGSCGAAAGSVSCDLDRLPAGASATLALSVAIPGSAGDLGNAVTVSYDEHTNDGPQADPKQDTIAVLDTIPVTTQTGAVQSWVPAGVTADLTTDPTGAGVASLNQPLVATVRVPAQGTGRIASVARAGGPFACPAKTVCRTGDWMQATIPGTFVDAPLQFGLRWDASLVEPKQSVRNLVAFHTDCLDDCPVETISRRCSSGAPAAFERPCLWAVKEEQDGDFSAVLIRDTNGYMR